MVTLQELFAHMPCIITDSQGTREGALRDAYSALDSWSDPQVSLAWVKVTHPIDLTLRAYWLAMGKTT